MSMAFEIVGKDFRKFWWGPQDCYLKVGLVRLPVPDLDGW
jgi:hypothetical protein